VLSSNPDIKNSMKNLRVMLVGLHGLELLVGLVLVLVLVLVLGLGLGLWLGLGLGLVSFVYQDQRTRPCPEVAASPLNGG